MLTWSLPTGFLAHLTANAVVPFRVYKFLPIHKNRIGLNLAGLADNDGKPTPAAFGFAIAEQYDFFVCHDLSVLLIRVEK
jgi:hypothetical protein